MVGGMPPGGLMLASIGIYCSLPERNIWPLYLLTLSSLWALLDSWVGNPAGGPEDRPQVLV